MNRFLLTIFAAPGALHAMPAAEVDNALERLLADAPGFQYAWASADEVLFSREGGVTDAFSGMAVTDRTAFAGFSLTKTFTALAILQLESEGKLRLEDRLSVHLPESTYRRESIEPTIQQILNHTAGFPNPLPIAWVHRLDTPFDRKHWFKTILTEHPDLKHLPGAKFAYSNPGYLMLGEIIERKSGMPYDAYVEKKIVEPLKLRPNERLLFRSEESPHFATGHAGRWSPATWLMSFMLSEQSILSDQSSNGWRTLAAIQMNGLAYGGMSGNHFGFVRYLQALLRGSAPFTLEFRDRLLTKQSTSDGKAIPMALSWWTGELNGETYFSHAGGGGGYYAEIRVYPRINRASVLLINRTGLSDQRMLNDIDRLFLDRHQ